MEMNLDGITVKLEIRGYTKHDREEEPCWCRADFSFISEPWLRYKRQDDSGEGGYFHSDFGVKKGRMRNGHTNLAYAWNDQ